MARASCLRWTLSLFVAQLVVSFAATAQSQGTTTVTGQFGQVTSPSDSLAVTFNCTGAPTCVGQVNIVERAPGCSNAMVESNPFTMTGLNLAQSGTLQGTMLVGPDTSINRLSNGTCTLVPQ